MKIKKILQALDAISFGYKSAFLLFIIMGGMISIIFLSQVSIYTIKNDYDLLFEKRTKSIIRLENIKDTYIVNINETLNDMQKNIINLQQSAEVITLARQLIEKNWSNYNKIISSEEYQISWLNAMIKKIFIMNGEKPNIILQQSIIKNIEKKQKRITRLLNEIFNPYTQVKDLSFYMEEMNYEINSLSIYITSLTNYDLNMAIQEKRDTNKIFDLLSLILNISIVLVFLFSALLSAFIISNFKKLHFTLQGDVLEKTEALQKLNDTLEIKIKKEVENSRKKDTLMFQQARLASMGEMIANIAHQWRQPLGSMMMIIQGVQSKMELGKLTPEIINSKVIDALLLAENMSDTLENFQNFFKPTKEKESFSLKSVIKHSLTLSKYILEQRKIKVSIKISDTIKLHTYYNELSHVFLNIIANAEDALGSIEGEKFIEIIAKEVNQKIFIYIIDNGGGIKKDILPHIFEPYFTTKYKSNGTGLGLYMSQQIIEKHMQGIIRCKNVCYTINNNKFEHCALFTIILPMKESTDDK
ncbi:MAG: histidine kinase [Sulfurovum sp.]|nr:MAG: histidine kinase [Sulfurovum sp.]